MLASHGMNQHTEIVLLSASVSSPVTVVVVSDF